MTHVEVIVSSCSHVPAPRRARIYQKDSPVQIFQSLKPSGPLDQSVTWTSARKVKWLPYRNLICVNQGDWGRWSEWSQCSANCALGEHEGEKTRERHLKEDPFQNPDFQVQPCDGQCPPGERMYGTNNQFCPQRLFKTRIEPAPSVSRPILQNELQHDASYNRQRTISHIGESHSAQLPTAH